MTHLWLFTLVACFAVLAQPPLASLRVSLISLGVEDMDRSVGFYGGILALPMEGTPGEVTLFRAGDVRIALNRPFGRVSAGRIVGATEIVFPVDSVTVAHTDLTRRGCVFLTGPREVTPGTWAATFADPDGHRLTILGPR